MKKLILIIIITIFTSCKNKVKTYKWSIDFTEHNRVLLYKKRPFTGRLLNYYKSGILKQESYYKDGKFNGSVKKWYSNGVLAEERFYKKGFKQGKHVGWWPSKIKKVEQYYDKEGLNTGVLKQWYITGKIYREFNYVKGKEQGTQKIWKTNGEISANYVVLNNDRFGLIGSKTCNEILK